MISETKKMYYFIFPTTDWPRKDMLEFQVSLYLFFNFRPKN